MATKKATTTRKNKTVKAKTVKTKKKTRTINLDRNVKRKYNSAGENIEHLYGYVH